MAASLDSSWDDESSGQHQRALRDVTRIYNLSLDMLGVATMEGYFQKLNPAWVETLGFSYEELMQKPYIEFVHPDDREATLAAAHKLAAGTAVVDFENRYLCKDGTYKWLAWRVVPYPEEGTVYFVARDVTARKAAERQWAQQTTHLLEAKQRLEAILNSSIHPILLISPNGYIQQVNPAFDRLLGYDGKEMLDTHLSTLVMESDRAKLEEEIHAAVTQENPRYLQISVRRKDGILLDTELALSLVGKTNDTPHSVVVTIQDVTKYKQVEEGLRRNLEEEHRLNELRSKFMGMVTHEFKNPLASILLSANTLRKHWHRLDDTHIQKKVEDILRCVSQMRNLVEDMLIITQAESQAFNPVSTDIAAFCHQVVEEFQQDIATGHRLRCSSQGQCTEIIADKKLLREALVNLLSNAVKYSSSGSTVALTVDCTGQDIQLTVQDEGMGIPEQDQKQLFEPFYRASNAADISGTGLGLMIVKNAIELHGGHIRVKSQIDAGTRFLITLPRES